MNKIFISVDEAFTHAGDFHTDDVVSGAFLKILNPQRFYLGDFVVKN